ncbi:uncharacterized protein LOC144097049 [Amblyomma americanum]
MEPAAKSQLVVPVNFDSEWSTPGGLEVRVDEVHSRFESYQVADADDCADLDAEWLDFARDHPDCVDNLGAFLDPDFEAFRRVDGDPCGAYEAKHLDLAGYKPESVTVRVREGVVWVTASESEKMCVVDNSAVKSWRKLERKFKLPDGMPPEAVCTEFMVDGRLKISLVPQSPQHKRYAAGENDSVSTTTTWNGSDWTDVETDGSKSSIVDR